MKSVITEKVTLEQLISWTVRGGWPGAIDLDLASAARIPKAYLQNIVEVDIRQVDGVNRDSKKLTMLLRSLARNVSTIVSIKTLVHDIVEDFGESVNEDTVADYLNALQRLFIIEDQRAFNPNMRSSVRVGKSSKRHFVDPSLAVAALGATPERLLNDLRTFGFLFESLCIRDLRIYAESIDAQLFHYRDATGREIDAVIELPDGTWGAFEIKLGANQIDEAARHLLSIKKWMKEDPKAITPSILCVVCGLIDFSYTREDGVMVVPIHALR
jgi:predicted AAA+ superfamily ATPase